MTDPLERRTLLKRAGAVTVLGSLAGCGGGGDGGDGEDGGAEEPDGAEEDSPTEGVEDDTGTEEGTDETPTEEGDEGTPTEGGEDGGGGDGEVPSEVDDYLSDTSNYDGSLTSFDEGEDVTVTVGAEGNDGNFAFEPPAIQVPSGTTVTWEWNGEGGAHNVVEENDEFRSGDPVESTDETFEYTFEEAGTFLYVCEPHASLGMRGAVVVE